MRRPLLYFAAVALTGICFAQSQAKPRTVPQADILRMASVDKRPIKVVKPVYPEKARKAGIQGVVVLDIVIGKAGGVEVARAIRGHPQLRPAARDAVKQWKWEPFLLNEKPIRIRTKVTINFELNTAKKDSP